MVGSLVYFKIVDAREVMCNPRLPVFFVAPEVAYDVFTLRERASASVAVLPLLFMNSVICTFHSCQVLEFKDVSVSLVSGLRTVTSVPVRYSSDGPMLSVARHGAPGAKTVLANCAGFDVRLVRVEEGPFRVRKGKATREGRSDAVQCCAAFGCRGTSAAFQRINVRLVRAVAGRRPWQACACRPVCFVLRALSRFGVVDGGEGKDARCKRLMSLGPALLKRGVSEMRVLPSNRIVSAREGKAINRRYRIIAKFGVRQRVRARVIKGAVAIAINVMGLRFLRALIMMLPNEGYNKATHAMVRVRERTMATNGLMVTCGLRIVQLIVLNQVPFSAVSKANCTQVVLARRDTQVDVTRPPIRFSDQFFRLRFRTMDVSLHVSSVHLRVIIRRSLNKATVVRVVGRLFMVSFCEWFRGLPQHVVMNTYHRLPTALELSVKITRLPNVYEERGNDVQCLVSVLPRHVRANLCKGVVYGNVAYQRSRFQSIVNLSSLSVPHHSEVHRQERKKRCAFLVYVMDTQSRDVRRKVTCAHVSKRPKDCVPFVPCVGNAFRYFVLLRFVVSCRQVEPRQLMNPKVRVVRLTRRARIRHVTVTNLVGGIHFSGPLIGNGERPYNEHFLRHFVVSMVMIIVARERISNRLFYGSDPPIYQRVRVIMNVLLVIVGNGAIIAVVTVSVRLITLIRHVQRSDPRVVRANFPVAVPTFIKRYLRCPIQVNHASARRGKDLFLGSKGLRVRLANRGPSAYEADGLFLIHLLTNSIRCKDSAPTVLTKSATLVGFHVLCRIQVGDHRGARGVVKIVGHSIVRGGRILIDNAPARVMSTKYLPRYLSTKGYLCRLRRVRLARDHEGIFRRNELRLLRSRLRAFRILCAPQGGGRLVRRVIFLFRLSVSGTFAVGRGLPVNRFSVRPASFGGVVTYERIGNGFPLAINHHDCPQLSVGSISAVRVLTNLGIEGSSNRDCRVSKNELMLISCLVSLIF